MNLDLLKAWKNLVLVIGANYEKDKNLFSRARRGAEVWCKQWHHLWEAQGGGQAWGRQSISPLWSAKPRNANEQLLHVITQQSIHCIVSDWNSNSIYFFFVTLRSVWYVVSHVCEIQIFKSKDQWTYFLIAKETRVGEMAQSVKCLPFKHENLSSDPQHYIKKKARHTLEGIGRDRRIPGACWPASLAKSVGSRIWPCLQKTNKAESDWRGCLVSASGKPYTCPCT